MARPSPIDSFTVLVILLVGLVPVACGSDSGSAFGSTGGTTNVAGSSSNGSAPSESGGNTSTNSTVGTGGVVAGIVNPDAGTFEPVTTVDSPETPYVTTCDSCPSSEPLHVQCSSGCCCAHYCDGQFGALGDKPCCDAQGGVIGVNCTAK